MTQHVVFGASGTLTSMRRRTGMPQTAVAENLGTTQSAVSRIERQEDMRLSTLRAYVAACGGHLRVVAEFDGFECEITL